MSKEVVLDFLKPPLFTENKLRLSVLNYCLLGINKPLDNVAVDSVNGRYHPPNRKLCQNPLLAALAHVKSLLGMC